MGRPHFSPTGFEPFRKIFITHLAITLSGWLWAMSPWPYYYFVCGTFVFTFLADLIIGLRVHLVMLSTLLLITELEMLRSGNEIKILFIFFFWEESKVNFWLRRPLSIN